VHVLVVASGPSTVPPPLFPVSIFEVQKLSDQSDNSQADWCVQKLSSWSFTDINSLVNCRSGR